MSYNQKMIQNTTFIVVDTETTGAVGATERVIEIGATKVRNGEITDTFHTLLNPERFIPHNVMQIHNITDPMVTAAPLFKEIADAFLDFMGDDGIFTAHNADFDKDFLNHELKRMGYATLKHQSLCTIKLAKKVYPGLKRYGLSSLCETFGILRPSKHRALDDSIATARILIRMFDELEAAGTVTLKDINLKSLPAMSPTLSLF